MTKKDYVLLAKVMREFYSHSDRFVVGEIVYALAEELKKDNPRFNKEKFFDACFKEEGES